MEKECPLSNEIAGREQAAPFQGFEERADDGVDEKAACAPRFHGCEDQNRGHVRLIFKRKLELRAPPSLSPQCPWGPSMTARCMSRTVVPMKRLLAQARAKCLMWGNWKQVGRAAAARLQVCVLPARRSLKN